MLLAFCFAMKLCLSRYGGKKVHGVLALARVSEGENCLLLLIRMIGCPAGEHLIDGRFAVFEAILPAFALLHLVALAVNDDETVVGSPEAFPVPVEKRARCQEFTFHRSPLPLKVLIKIRLCLSHAAHEVNGLLS